MKGLLAFFTMSLTMLVTFGANVVSMIWGWGVEPQNWFVIGGSYIAIWVISMFIHISSAVLQELS